jgi:hypothetical protein
MKYIAFFCIVLFGCVTWEKGPDDGCKYHQVDCGLAGHSCWSYVKNRQRVTILVEDGIFFDPICEKEEESITVIDK